MKVAKTMIAVAQKLGTQAYIAPKNRVYALTSAAAIAKHKVHRPECP
jgi:hypothetical protein